MLAITWATKGDCWCGKKKSNEHASDCEKVKELFEKKNGKEKWMKSERNKDLMDDK